MKISLDRGSAPSSVVSWGRRGRVDRNVGKDGMYPYPTTSWNDKELVKVMISRARAERHVRQSVGLTSMDWEINFQSVACCPTGSRQRLGSEKLPLQREEAGVRGSDVGDGRVNGILRVDPTRLGLHVEPLQRHSTRTTRLDGKVDAAQVAISLDRRSALSPISEDLVEELKRTCLDVYK